MKQKILNSLLIFTSLIGYIEWAGQHHGFLFQLEYEIILKFFQDPIQAIHPLTILPLFGQLILLATLFQKKPNPWLSLSGLICIALLIVLITFIGAMSLNFRIFFSGLPFICCSVFAIKNNFKKN